MDKKLSLGILLTSILILVAISVPLLFMPFHIEQTTYFFDKTFAETPQLQVVELTIQSIGYRLFGIGHHNFKRTFYNSTTLEEIPIENVLIYMWKTYKTVYDNFYTVWIEGNQTVVNSTSGTYKVYFWKTEKLNYSNTEVFRDFDSSIAIQWAINHTDKVRVTDGCYYLTKSIVLDSNTHIVGGTYYFGKFPAFKILNGNNIAVQNITVIDP